MSAPDLVAPRAPTHCPGFVTDLVVRCGRGDANALARLFELFYAPVSAAVAQQAQECAAEELTAKVFVRLWRHAHTYQPGDQSAVDWVLAQVPIVLSGVSTEVRSRPGSATALSSTGGAPNRGLSNIPYGRSSTQALQNCESTPLAGQARRTG